MGNLLTDTKSNPHQKDAFAEGLSDDQARLVDEFSKAADRLNAQFESIVVDQVMPPDYQTQRVALLRQISNVAAQLQAADIEIAFWQDKNIYKPEQPEFSDRDTVDRSPRSYFYSVFRMATQITTRPADYKSLFIADVVLARKDSNNKYNVRPVVPMPTTQ